MHYWELAAYYWFLPVDEFKYCLGLVFMLLAHCFKVAVKFTVLFLNNCMKIDVGNCRSINTASDV